ncbi:hypothetical protein CEXT_776091 [Caerostris extrusa]|uniref:Uncharacterized protein n=1 Tax=Caerostris extrusa TaxID=172846 RepID=A0AAV4TGL2_CAEEX|nr:hypothetical protein CEXT_776091 [Caerostris extrusa]
MLKVNTTHHYETRHSEIIAEREESLVDESLGGCQMVIQVHRNEFNPFVRILCKESLPEVPGLFWEKQVSRMCNWIFRFNYFGIRYLFGLEASFPV